MAIPIKFCLCIILMGPVYCLNVLRKNSISDRSLVQTLSQIQESLPLCFLTIIYDEERFTNIIQNIVNEVSFLQSTEIQIWGIGNHQNLDNLIWDTRRCEIHILLLGSKIAQVLRHLESGHNWNYDTHAVFIVDSKKQLMDLCRTSTVQNTEKTIGIILDNNENSIYKQKQFPERRVVKISDGNITRPLFHTEMMDLKGRVVKAVTFEFPPTVFYEYGENGQLDIKGIDASVLGALADTLNFQIHYMEPPKGELWGDRTSTGNWTGLMGMLARKETDIGFAILYLTYERQDFVDFSSLYHQQMSCFMASSAAPEAQWKSLLKPFQFNAWLAIFCMLCITAFSLPVLVIISSTFSRRLTTSVQAMLLVFMAHTGVSSNRIIVWASNLRVFLIFLWFYGFIVMTAFSSNLTAFLTVVQPPESFETIRELREKQLEVASVGKFFGVALSSAVDDDLKALAKQYSSYETRDEIWPQVFKGSSVYLHSQFILEYHLVEFMGKVRIMEECFSPYYTVLYLQKNSILTKKFNRIIIRLFEAGLPHRWFEDTLIAIRKKERKINRTTNNNMVISLSVSHMQGIFFVFLIGDFLGFLVFVAEIYSNNRKKYHK